MSREDEYDFLFKGIVAPFWRSCTNCLSTRRILATCTDACVIVVLIGDSGVGMS